MVADDAAATAPASRAESAPGAERASAPAAQAQTTATSSATSSAQAQPTSALASAAAAQVATEIASHAGSRRTRFEVRLDPGELGRIDVRLDIGHDGRVATRLIVEKAETLDMLKQDARELTRQLEQAGFQLGQGGLAFQLKDGRQTFVRDDADERRSDGAVAEDIEEAAPALAAYARSPLSAAGVDRTV
ncbi:flagellar hook-length control protein FliK [Chenggangzhangella methanolivorans]|uniref:Flagellar hook-length control protein FliK n=2 Tax=Chenggangzhangella methanolivorans TaxID=1437009 RepID=A0A9E6UMK0_9HYPH|nr:flagellar hook-length control protein FliK [Chenggangzhangella methanolivorans]QZN99268.1 flagellar hook-length control protein FliK [Chenggangzhangella methanolivorans]